MSSAAETDVLSRGASGGGAEKSLKLPKASVKRMMKLSDETVNVSVESVVAPGRLKCPTSHSKVRFFSRDLFRRKKKFRESNISVNLQYYLVLLVDHII